MTSRLSFASVSISPGKWNLVEALHSACYRCLNQALRDRGADIGYGAWAYTAGSKIGVRTLRLGWVDLGLTSAKSNSAGARWSKFPR